MTLTLPNLPAPRLRRWRREKPPAGAVPVAQAAQALEPTPLTLSTTAIFRNLLSSNSGTWAYFLLEPQRWAFLSGLPGDPDKAGDRGALLDRIALRTADLAGHRIHLRATAHPLPYSTWASHLHDASPNRLPDIDGAETWNDYLVAGQQRIAQLRAESPATYLGVRLTTRQMTRQQLASLRDGTAGPDDLTKLRASLRRINGVMRKGGFGGKPVSDRGLAWLMHSSLGLGIPVNSTSLAAPTGGWGPDDMRSFTGPVYPAATPYSPTVRLRASRNGRQHERHVAILTVDTFGAREVLSPGLWPWASHNQTLPFHTEWSMTLDVNSGRDMERAAEIVRQRAEGIEEHYQEHNQRPPAAVARAIVDAARIEDEVQEGAAEVACRLVGPIRMAVVGDTETEALEHAETAIASYAEHQKITLTHEFGQFAMWREFIPGESPQLSSFTHVFNAAFFASAVPHASVILGDQTGPYLGFTGRRVVTFNPNWGPEHDRSGLAFLLGTQGAGKSTLLGCIAEPNVRRGRQTTLYDGSGAMARLVTESRHLRKHARTFELTGATPGMLIPYRLIPEPRKHDFPTGDRAWMQARVAANAERRDLMIDTITMLMPPRLLAEDPKSTGIIEDAVNLCGGDYGTDPWRVVDELERSGNDTAKAIADRLRAAAQRTGGALIFPEQGETDPGETVDFDAVLTVVTMRGLAIPPEGRPPTTRAEQMSQPILNLVSRHAAKVMYANHEPKMIAVSEGSLVTGGESSFRAFMDRAAVETRKTDTFFAIDTQNPAHVLRIAPEITNLLGCAFAGRMGSLEAATAALPFLTAPGGHGFERALMDLEPGQFIGRFYDGAVGPLQVDRDYRPELARILGTTPGDAGAFTSHGAWAVEE